MKLTDQQIAGMTRQQLIDLVRTQEKRIGELEDQIDDERDERREAKEQNS